MSKSFRVENSEVKISQIFRHKVLLKKCSKVRMSSKSHIEKLSEKSRIMFKFPDNISRRILNIGNMSHLATYMILLSAIEYVINTLINDSEALICLPVMKNSKNNIDLRDIAIFKSNIINDITYKSYLIKVKDKVKDANKYNCLTYKEFYEYLNIKKSRNEVLNIFILLENIHSANFSFKIDVDIEFLFSINDSEIECKINYSKSLFRKKTVLKIINCLMNFFKISLDKPNIKLRDIDIFSKYQDIEILSSHLIHKPEKFTVKNVSSYDLENENMMLLKKGKEEERNVFFIHDGSGESDSYIKIVNNIDCSFNCWGIRADIRKNIVPRNIKIEDMALDYMNQIRKIQICGPYNICGWSLGGTIAFEIARLLEERNELVNFLGIIDSLPPFNTSANYDFEFNIESERSQLKNIFLEEEVKDIINQVTRIEDLYNIFIAYAKKNTIRLKTIKEEILESFNELIPSDIDDDIEKIIYYANTIRTLNRARDIYVPKNNINTCIHFFKASESSADSKEDWSRYSYSEIKCYEVFGNHHSIFRQPNVVNFSKLLGEIFNNDNKIKYYL